MTAYFVGKAYGVNLQEERSKNLGARNAGSVIGKGAFIWTFLGDSLKGALVVGLGRLWHFEEWAIVLGACLVMLGHLFPVWLKFNGGKGVATFIGVGLALSPSLFLMMVLGTAITLSSTVVSGKAVGALYSGLAFVFSQNIVKSSATLPAYLDLAHYQQGAIPFSTCWKC
ncbi:MULTISPECIES: glycerol-3-phosphate acyltransferase [Lysinibacillus]|nr:MULTISPECIES: glycerol-3-phosphate acyltransferase [Lysinibacillus]